MHGISRWGVNIAPGVRAGRHVGRRRASTAAPAGRRSAGSRRLFVDWSLPEIADAAHEPTRIRADRPARALLSRGDSRFAVVRTKDVWYAVRATRGGKHPEELREDFGLMALKIRGKNGDWRDVVRLRPITRGEGDPTDSAGPVLLRDAGLKAFPFTERAQRASATARSSSRAACAARRTRSSGSSRAWTTGRSCARSTSRRAR